ncbi:MAG: hypothetical protein R6T96_08035, partial [Longimicrobiales bacterium]
YLFFALLSAVLLKSSPVACKREVKQGPDSGSRPGLLLPASNPLKGFDAIPSVQVEAEEAAS